MSVSSASDEKGGGGGASQDRDALASPKLLDAAAISAEARSAGVRTPKLPDLPAEEEAPPPRNEKPAATPKPPPSADPPKKKGEEEDEFEALAKRFEALKKR